MFTIQGKQIPIEQKKRLERIASYRNQSLEEFLSQCTPTFNFDKCGPHDQIAIWCGQKQREKLHIDKEIAPLVQFLNTKEINTTISCQYNYSGNVIVSFSSLGFARWIRRLYWLTKEHYLKNNAATIDQYQLQTLIGLDEFLELFLTATSHSFSKLRFESCVYDNFDGIVASVTWEFDAERLPWVYEQIKRLTA